MNGLLLVVVIVCWVGAGIGGVTAEPYPIKEMVEGELALVNALIVPVFCKSPHTFKLIPGLIVRVAPGSMVTFFAIGSIPPGPFVFITG
jgi:hypothetical protein